MLSLLGRGCSRIRQNAGQFAGNPHSWECGYVMPAVKACLPIALMMLFTLTLVTAQQPPSSSLPSIAPNLARLDQTLGGLDGPGFALAYDAPTGALAAPSVR